MFILNPLSGQSRLSFLSDKLPQKQVEKVIDFFLRTFQGFLRKRLCRHQRRLEGQARAMFEGRPAVGNVCGQKVTCYSAVRLCSQSTFDIVYLDYIIS